MKKSLTLKPMLGNRQSEGGLPLSMLRAQGGLYVGDNVGHFQSAKRWTFFALNIQEGKIWEYSYRRYKHKSFLAMNIP